MSYTIYIQKFAAGEPSNFEFSELERIVSKHGEIVAGEFGLEIISKKSLFEHASLGKKKFEISSIAIHRPNHNEELQKLVFDLLKIHGTCFFDQELGFLQTRTSDLSDFPEELLENLPSRVTLLESSEQVWPEAN